MRSRFLAVPFALVLAAIGTTTAAPAASAAPAPTASGPALTDPRPCAKQPGFTCSFLTVPLDHRRQGKGTVRLQVATSDNAKAPKGVLLFLTGGPGQPGAPFVQGIAKRMPDVAKNYRLVTIDQRGTGQYGALDCPKLQARVGSSDIVPPGPAEVAECAKLLGERRNYFTTEQTTDDLDLLRRALGVRTMAVDGVSYGTVTGASYAARYPRSVNKLVLDSVLPHVDPQRDNMLYLTGLRATAPVLRDACATAPACGFDPAADLAWLARTRKDAVLIWDMLVTYQYIDPTFRDPDVLPGHSSDVVTAIHQARHGSPARLNALVRMLRPQAGKPTEFSAGLHIATICGDGRFPWGTSQTPQAARPAALELVRRHLPTRATWPFTADTAAGNGFVQACLRWPATRYTAEPPAKLRVPALLLNGDRDLSTPVEWAREELRRAPLGKLVVVRGATHSVQDLERGTQGRDAVARFLNG